MMRVDPPGDQDRRGGRPLRKSRKLALHVPTECKDPGRPPDDKDLRALEARHGWGLHNPWERVGALPLVERLAVDGSVERVQVGDAPKGEREGRHRVVGVHDRSRLGVTHLLPDCCRNVEGVPEREGAAPLRRDVVPDYGDPVRSHLPRRVLGVDALRHDSDPQPLPDKAGGELANVALQAAQLVGSQGIRDEDHVPDLVRPGSAGAAHRPATAMASSTTEANLGATTSSLNWSTNRCLARLPSRARSSGFAMRRAMACASSTMLFGSTITPQPSSTSGRSETRVAITGRAIAIASNTLAGSCAAPMRFHRCASTTTSASARNRGSAENGWGPMTRRYGRSGSFSSGPTTRKARRGSASAPRGGVTWPAALWGGSGRA